MCVCVCVCFVKYTALKDAGISSQIFEYQLLTKHMLEAVIVKAKLC